MEKRSGPENWNILSRRHQENNRDPAKEAEGYLVSEKENRTYVASGSCMRR